MNPCPCHSAKSYDECCKPYHDGKAAPDALALMRSRFSAYALGLADYIQKTTHPKSPHFDKDRLKWSKGIALFSENTEFVDLKILESSPGYVSFIAYIKQGGKDVELREKSRFEQIDGKWFYLEGEVEVVTP